jgi:hypothetical protein
MPLDIDYFRFLCRQDRPEKHRIMPKTEERSKMYIQKMSKDAQRTHDQGCQMVIFRPKNTILGVSILEVLGTENVNRYIPWPFGIYCVHFVIFNGHLVHFWSFGIFFPFGYVAPRKIWQPCYRVHCPNFVGKNLKTVHNVKLILFQNPFRERKVLLKAFSAPSEKLPGDVNLLSVTYFNFAKRLAMHFPLKTGALKIYSFSGNHLCMYIGT